MKIPIFGYILEAINQEDDVIFSKEIGWHPRETTQLLVGSRRNLQGALSYFRQELTREDLRTNKQYSHKHVKYFLIRPLIYDRWEYYTKKIKYQPIQDPHLIVTLDELYGECADPS